MDFLKSLLTNSSDALSAAAASSTTFDFSALLFQTTSNTAAVKSYLLSHIPPDTGSYIHSLLSADLLTVLSLLLAVFFGFKVLDYLRRLVIYWIVLAIKLVLMLCALQVGVYCYTVGAEKSLQDLGRVWGWVEGYIGAYS
jgi:Nuclear pore assembly and biogenesis